MYNYFAQPEECASALCKVFASPELELEILLGLLDICLQRLAEFKDLLSGKERQEGASYADAWSWTICIRFIFGFSYGDGLALPELTKTLRSKVTNDDDLAALLLQQLRLTLGAQAPGAFIATELIDALRSPLGPMPTDLILATCMYNVDACCRLSLQALFAILEGVSSRELRSWIGTYHSCGLTQQTAIMISVAVGWLKTPLTAAPEPSGCDDSNTHWSQPCKADANSPQSVAVPEALQKKARCAMKLMAALVWSCPTLAQKALKIVIERLGDEGPEGAGSDSPLWDVLHQIVQDAAAMLGAVEDIQTDTSALSQVEMLAGDVDTFGELLCQCEELLHIFGSHATLVLSMSAPAAVQFTQLLGPLLPFSDHLVRTLCQAAVNRVALAVDAAAAEDEAAEAAGRKAINGATAQLNGHRVPSTLGHGQGDAASPMQSMGGPSSQRSGMSARSESFMSGASQRSMGVSGTSWALMERWQHSPGCKGGAAADDTADSKSKLNASGDDAQVHLGDADVALEVLSCTLVHCRHLPRSMEREVLALMDGLLGLACRRVTAAARVRIGTGQRRAQSDAALVSHRILSRVQAALAVMPTVGVSGTRALGSSCGDEDGAEDGFQVPAAHDRATGADRRLHLRSLFAGRMALSLQNVFEETPGRGAVHPTGRSTTTGLCSEGSMGGIKGDEAASTWTSLANCLRWRLSDAGRRGSAFVTGWRAVQRRAANHTRWKVELSAPPLGDMIRLLAQAVAAADSSEEVMGVMENAAARDEQLSVLAQMLIHAVYGSCISTGQLSSVCPARTISASYHGAQPPSSEDSGRAEVIALTHIRMQVLVALIEVFTLHPHTVGLSILQLTEPLLPATRAAASAPAPQAAAGITPPMGEAAPQPISDLAAVQGAVQKSVKQAVEASNNGLVVPAMGALTGLFTGTDAQLKAGHDGAAGMVKALAACHLALQSKLACLRPTTAVADSVKIREPAAAPTPQKAQLPAGMCAAAVSAAVSAPGCVAKEKNETRELAPVRSGLRPDGSTGCRPVGFMMRKSTATSNAAVSARGAATSTHSQGTTTLTPPPMASLVQTSLSVCPQDAWLVSRHDAWPLPLESSLAVLLQLLEPPTVMSPHTASAQIQRWRVLAHCTSLVLKSLISVWLREERLSRHDTQCEGPPAKLAPAKRLLAAGLVAVEVVTCAREAQEAALGISSAHVRHSSQRDGSQQSSSCAPAALARAASSVQLTADPATRGSVCTAPAGAETSEVPAKESVSTCPESTGKPQTPSRVKNVLKSLSSNMQTITHSLKAAGQGGRTRLGSVATPPASRRAPLPLSSQSGASTVMTGAVAPTVRSQLATKLNSSVAASVTATTDKVTSSTEAAPGAENAQVRPVANEEPAADELASLNAAQLAAAAGQACASALRLLAEVVRTAVAQLPRQAATPTTPPVTLRHEHRHPSSKSPSKSNVHSVLVEAASVLGPASQHGASPPVLPSVVEDTAHATAATAPPPALETAQSLLSSLVRTLYPTCTRHAAVRFGLFVQRPDVTSFMGFLRMVDECPHAGAALCALLEANCALMGRGMSSFVATSAELQEAHKEHVAALIELATAFSTAELGDDGRAEQLVDMASNIGMRMLLATGPATLGGSCKHWTAILSSAAKAVDVVGGIGCRTSAGSPCGKVLSGSEAEHLASLACRGLAPASVSDIAAQLLVALTDAARSQGPNGSASGATLPVHRPIAVQPVCAMMLRKALLSRVPLRGPGSQVQVPATAGPAWLTSSSAAGLARVLLTLGAAVRPVLTSVLQAVAEALGAEEEQGEGRDAAAGEKLAAGDLGLEELPVAVATALACACLATDRLLASVPSSTAPVAAGTADASDAFGAARDPIVDTALLLWALPQLMAAVHCVKASTELLLYRAAKESAPSTAPSASPSPAGGAPSAHIRIQLDQPGYNLSLCQVVALGRFYLPQLDGLLTQIQSGPAHLGQRLRLACRTLRSEVEECEAVWLRLQEVLDAAEPLAADLAPRARHARKQPLRLVPPDDMPSGVALLFLMRRATAWACGQQQEMPSGATFLQSEQQDPQASGAPECNSGDDDSIPDEPLFLLWGCVTEDEDEQRQTTDDDPHKAGRDDAGNKAPNAADADASQPRSALQQQAPPAFRAIRPLRTDAAPHHSKRFQDLLSGKTMPQLGASRGAQPATAAFNTDNSEPRPEAKPAAAETARAAGGSVPLRRSRRIMLQPVLLHSNAAAGVCGGGSMVSQGAPLPGTTPGPTPAVPGVSPSCCLAIEGGCSAIARPLSSAAASVPRRATRLAAAAIAAGRAASGVPCKGDGARPTARAGSGAVERESGRSSGRSQVSTGPSAGKSAAAKQSGPGGVAERKRARDEEEVPEPKRAKKRKEPRNAYVAACLRETSGRESGSEREWSDLEDFIVCQPGRNYTSLLGRKYQYAPVDEED